MSARTHGDLAVLKRLLGDLEGARKFGESSVAIAEEARETFAILLNRIALARVHFQLGNLEDSSSLIRDVVVAAERERLFHPLVLGLEDRGDHAFEDGRFAEALADYRCAFELIESPEKGEYPGELAWRIGLTHLRLGDFESSEEWITRGLDICEKTGDAKEHAVTIRAHGVLLIANGQAEAGFAQLQDALERLQRLGVPFEAGRTHLEFARASALLPKNAATPSISHLESAKAIFTKMGCGLGLRWVEELAAQLNSPAPSEETAASLDSAAIAAAESLRHAAPTLDLGPGAPSPPLTKRPTPPRPYSPPISESLLDEYLESAPPAPRTLRFASTTLGIPWRAPLFLEALDHLRHFARSKAPLLIQGETGAGKTAFAEAAHLLGRNPTEPFLVVNCASLPESLLESELFGHVRGAFTGAERDKPGLIRSAGAGTIFLDEVDKASSSFQANLLHVLDRREIRALGSHSYQEVRARFVLATNRDLAQLSFEGKFLSDLEFRISGLRVDLPPLRDRFSDLDLLLALALRELRLHEGITKSIHPEARHFLASYAWPGNVRELFSVVTAAALLSSDDVEVLGRADIERAFKHGRRRAHLQRAARTGDLASRMDELEREELLLVLRLEGGNQSSASRKLGITRRGLNKKLHRLGLIEQLDAEGLKYFDSRSARGAATESVAGDAPTENENGRPADHDADGNGDDDSFLESI